MLGSLSEHPLAFLCPLEHNRVYSSFPTKQFFILHKFKTSDKILKSNKNKLKFCDCIEIIVGNGENAGFQHFLLFPTVFQNPSSTGSFKSGTVWLRVAPITMDTKLFMTNLHVTHDRSFLCSTMFSFPFNTLLNIKYFHLSNNKSKID